MKLAALLLLLAGCNGCHKGPPTPPPAPPYPLGDQAVYDELTLAGCLAPSDGGLQAVTAEHRSAAQPAWLACLYNGGTIQGCQVPCAH